MWPTNALTERLNLKYPILQAPMGSASTPALAAAVTNAGGLGGLGMWARSAAEAGRRIAGFRQQSGGSLNVNYPIWPDPSCAPETREAMRRHLQAVYDSHGVGAVPQPRGEVSDVGPEHIALLLETKPEVVSFHFGLPEPEVLDALKAAGIFVLSSATTVAEARLLEERGCDAVIAQGTEAGGHRATFTGVEIGMQPGLFALLPQIVDAVDVPVVAAGGVADGRTAAAAFMLGASAVQVGTAFLRCEEADVRDQHRAALAAANDSCTVVTNVISGRSCRYIRNAMIDDLTRSGLQPLPVPAQQSLTSPLAVAGDREWTPLTAGQSAALAKDTKASDLIERLATETARRLRAFA
ncbi:MAG TPA: nitronate monooxygenase family protein [Stellaceae bacterium]|nr:nitronate monooxygenase family protein [Stellaceae bacterium]